MPIPLALIGAGAALGGAGIAAASTGSSNRRSQEFTRYMYQTQRRDALSDWNLQNEYNSPQAQMKRFQEAGLNPNLIYGQGNSGNSGAVNAPDHKTPQFQPVFDGRGIESAGLTYMNSMYDLDIKKAQLDNLKAQNQVILQDAILRGSQVMNTDSRTQRQNFDMSFEKNLAEVSAEARREQLRQLKVTTDNSIDENIRRAASNSQSIQESAQRILQMIEQRENIKLERGRIKASTFQSQMESKRIAENIKLMLKDGTLKDMDIELRKAGINPNDPMWARVVGRFLTNLTSEEGFNNTSSNIWDWIFK
jgi:hypothetical protein